MQKSKRKLRCANDEKPIPFDLVTMIYKDGSKQDGWWTGTVWDSGKPLRKNRKIIYWKKIAGWTCI